MNIFSFFARKRTVVKKETKNTMRNLILLKQDMSKDEKKLLLNIIDAKDLLIEEAAHNNYKKGFSDGVHFILSVFTKSR